MLWIWHAHFYTACRPQLHVFRLLNDLHLRLQLLILIYQLAVWWNHSLSGLLQQVTMLIYQWGNMDLFNSKKIISVLTKNYFLYSNPSLFACDLGYIEDYSDTWELLAQNFHIFDCRDHNFICHHVIIFTDVYKGFVLVQWQIATKAWKLIEALTHCNKPKCSLNETKEWVLYRKGTEKLMLRVISLMCEQIILATEHPFEIFQAYVQCSICISCSWWDNFKIGSQIILRHALAWPLLQLVKMMFSPITGDSRYLNKMHIRNH